MLPSDPDDQRLLAELSGIIATTPDPEVAALRILRYLFGPDLWM